MSKTDTIIMGCLYLILGIPLVVVASNAPEVDDISHLSLENQNDKKTFLNYPPNSVIAADIAPLQRLICLQPNISPKRCSDLLQYNRLKANWKNNAHKLNSLRAACMIIGIILCIMGFFRLLLLAIPKQQNLKKRTKKLNF